MRLDFSPTELRCRRRGTTFPTTNSAQGHTRVERGCLVHLEKKDLVLLIPATLLAIAGLGPDDLWVVGPCLFLSWITFIVVCIIHEGPRITRSIIGVVITLALCGVG